MLSNHASSRPRALWCSLLVISFYAFSIFSGCTPSSTCTDDALCGQSDRDGDGYDETVDCDDANAAVYPGAPEICDGLDQDCDQEVDEAVADAPTWYLDGDGDGFGDADSTVQGCDQPEGYLDDSSDCDDARADVNPGAAELCNGVDDNCRDGSDEGVKSTYYPDRDQDQYGASAGAVSACSAPAGYTADHTDCDDSNAAVYPGAAEACNGLDDNCNGSPDEGFELTSFYLDSDLDGYGDVAHTQDACSAPPGYVDNALDCDDGSSAVSPAASELCDLTDNDCNGLLDEGFPVNTYYADTDGDGYGVPDSTTEACTLPPGYSAVQTDCDDLESNAYPGAPELCNEKDDNCNGVVDEGGATIAYLDADGDGYGNPEVFTAACPAPVGYVGVAGDCNDGDAAIHPGVTERCNFLDDDCDDAVDEGIAYLDVASGESHTLLLCSDGAVLAWGFNGSGQLGNDTLAQSEVPIQVAGISGATAIAAGNQHSLAITGSGTLYAWGYNGEGQLGDGTHTTRFKPITVAAVSGVVQIAAGASHTVIVQKDGTIFAWGDNTYGQLGTGGSSTATPTKVNGLSMVSAIASGNHHTLAIASDGGVWAWGDNTYGQLGVGNNTARATPTLLTAITAAKSIGAGHFHSLLVRPDGTLWSFGRNQNGQLGDGSTTSRNAPVQIFGMTGMVQATGGGQHSLARNNSGQVWAWGANWSGQLGVPSDTGCDPNRPADLTCRVLPAQLSELAGITDLSAGYLFSVALQPNQFVWAWGDNTLGQLGDGSTTARTTPTLSFGDE